MTERRAVNDNVHPPHAADAKAWLAGYDAGLHRRPRLECPYAPSDPAAPSWHSGYLDAAAALPAGRHYFGKRTIEGLVERAVPTPHAAVKGVIAAAAAFVAVYGVAPLIPLEALAGLVTLGGIAVLTVGVWPLAAPPLNYALDRASDFVLYIAGKINEPR